MQIRSHDTLGDLHELHSIVVGQITEIEPFRVEMISSLPGTGGLPPFISTLNSWVQFSGMGFGEGWCDSDAGVKRLVVLSAAAHFPGIPNRIASFIMRNHMRDSLAMEGIVQFNGLEWTIARPPRLTQDDSVTYRSREDAAPKMGFTLSRKAVAAFMLDAIEQHEHVHKIVGIAK